MTCVNRIYLICLMVLIPIACDDTSGNNGDEDNKNKYDSSNNENVSVLTFQFSGCKDFSGLFVYDSSQFPELLTGRKRENYDGLQCVAWDASDSDQILIDLINIYEDCGFFSIEDDLWTAVAEQREDDMLGIAIEWDFEYPNACGICPRDFSLEIDNVQYQKKDFTLEVKTRGCTKDCKWKEITVDLPVEENAQGIICRYINIAAYPKESKKDGTLHMRPDDASGCEEGLTVIENEYGTEICVYDCSNGTKCPLSEILTCKKDICQLKSTW